MKTLQFPSKDGLIITADYYEIENPKEYILLCHRSHCNRAEYRETAPKLNALGYACLVIDQRSGMKVFGETNETSKRAKEQKKATGYLDARIDIEAGVDYLFDMVNKPIILLGSSYSASLSLLIAAQSKKLKSLILFSPAECLKGIIVREKIAQITIPTYATSAKKEINETREILSNIEPQYVTHFEPTNEGFHGSKLLWESVKGFEQYWVSLESFLTNLA